MKLGYLIGGTLSLLFYKIDRKRVASTIKWVLESRVKNKKIIASIYALGVILIGVMMYLIPESDAMNGIVAFSVLEISGAAKETRSGRIKKTISERRVFYDTLATMGKSLIGSFITPLLIIIFLGNSTAMVYGIIYFFFNGVKYTQVEKILNILFIIPSLIGDGLLYFVYVCRNKTFKIDFKGEFLENLLYMPLLNIFVLGAYIETVNFYHIENCEVVHYLKSYGGYHGKADEIAINDLITIIYGVAGVAFILFIFIINLNLNFKFRV